MKNVALLVLSLSIPFQSFPSFASREPWKDYEAPQLLDPQYQLTFDSLPLNGKLEDAKMPWSDDYWASYRGQIAFRWNAKDPQAFKYHSPSKAEAQNLTVDQLKELSPAEKYDLYMGRYDYPTVHEIWAVTSPSKPQWEGICHGWSPAALNHPEPAAVTVLNPDGIAVPFGSSDVKALISFYYANAQDSVETRLLGNRCNTDIKRHRNFFDRLFRHSPMSDCKGTNAGTFHIVIANQLGLKKEGFVADVDRGIEVWNQPVYGFESRIVKTADGRAKDSAKQTVKRVLVETTMHYTREINPQWEPVNGTDSFASGTRDYKYWLELDASNQIVGGKWESDERPDFLWKMGKAPFTDYFSGLNEIYKPAKAQ